MADGQTGTLKTLTDRLRTLSQEGAPQLATLAGWLLDRPHELAFQSVRGLASEAQVNSNTVVRLAHGLGFDGYEACRAAFQEALRGTTLAYSARAAALRNRDDEDVFDSVRAAALSNVEALFSPEMNRLACEAAAMLGTARSVHCVGVRSCYGAAHYFAYLGRMAFPNFAPPVTVPGAIMDTISETGPEDVLVAITFSYYSAEVVRACEIARDCGARIIALTDSYAAPIAEGAELVVPLPMSGPQIMPSQMSAILVAELILAEMAARSDAATDRIQGFEARIRRLGGYIG